MEQINNKMMDLLLSYAENAGWRYTLWSEKITGKQGNNSGVRNFAELKSIPQQGKISLWIFILILTIQLRVLLKI